MKSLPLTIYEELLLKDSITNTNGKFIIVTSNRCFQQKLTRNNGKMRVNGKTLYSISLRSKNIVKKFYRIDVSTYYLGGINKEMI